MAMRQVWLTLAISARSTAWCAVSYFLLGILSSTPLHINHYVVGFWLPSGLVIALAFQRGYGVLPGIFLGEMAIGLFFHQGPLWMHVGVALSQCLQGVIVCWLAPRLMKSKDIFISLPNLWGFLITAFIANTVHTLLGGWLIPHLAGQEILAITWFIGGLSGIVVFAPVVLSWMATSRTKFKFHWLELTVLSLAALVGVNLLNWQMLADIRGLWLIVYTSFLFWGAFRFPPPIATVISLYLVELFCFIPPDIWTKGFDIAPNPIREANVPILMTTYLIVGLVMLVVNGDRQRLTETLKALNQQLQERVAQQADELDEAQTALAKAALSITEAIPVGTYTMVLPPNATMAHFSFMSDKFLQICGLDREEVAADALKGFACVHPDDYDAFLALNTETFARKIAFCEETRLIVDGEVRWIRAESVPRDLPDGSTLWEGVVVDITKDKLNEQQLQLAYAEIRDFNQDLERRVKERTAELEKSKAQFQRLVEDIGDQFVIFSHTNKAVLLYLGGGFKAIFGTEVESILGQSWISTINWHPDSLTLALNQDKRLLNGEDETQEFEMGFTRPDGEQRIIKIIQHPVYDHAGNVIAVEGMLEDITKEKQFINALAASESKFRTFIETANDLIFSIDSTARFTYLSPNTVDILGYSAEELQGVAYADIVHPDDLSQCDQAFQRLMGGHRVRGLEYRVRRKDGTWRWHSTSLTPEFDSQGNIVGLFGFAFDFTNRKLAAL
ncbi:MAG: hypothetical protein RLZZ490_1402, partial [Cyanobacteriota bacterium]